MLAIKSMLDESPVSELHPEPSDADLGGYLRGAEASLSCPAPSSHLTKSHLSEIPPVATVDIAVSVC